MPRKAAYERFEDDPETEFAFVLAETLHMTVADVNDMSHDEYIRWYVYIGRKRQQQELAHGRR